MKKVFLALFFGMVIFSAHAQIENLDRSNNNMFKNDSTQFSKEFEFKFDSETKYTDYKIISIHNDTSVIDTTLTLKKDFIFNYLRKDNFELLPFHNQGQTFNRLAYNFENNSIIPIIGFSSKQFNYSKHEDIHYYNVPTPTSEFMYRTGLEQGQVLDAFLTMNTTKQFNISLAYKGLRSIGKYRHSLASHGNFKTTFNYHSKNNIYSARGYFSSFDLFNNENGGLPLQSINFFESNDPNYIDRARLDVNYTNAENMLEGKRYFIEQQFTLFSKKNKIDNHNTLVNDQIQKYNSVLGEIEKLKKRTDTSSTNTKIESLNKSTSLTKKIPPKKIDSLVKRDSISNTNFIKIDSLPNKNSRQQKGVRNKPDSIAKKNIVKIDSVPKNIPFQKSDTIIKQDSIVENNVVKIDSVIKSIPLQKRDTIIKSDSIVKNNSVKIDSLTKSIQLQKMDSVAKLDSIAKNNIKKIDSLTIVAAEIKIDTTHLLPITINDLFDLKFGHTFLYETRHYRFKQSGANQLFGDAFDQNIVDHTSYQTTDNQVYLQLYTPNIGTLKVKANYLKYNYHYNSILYYNDSRTISDKLKGNALIVGADWKTKIGKLYLNADASSIISGDITGNVIKAAATFKKDSVYSFKGYAEIASKTPSFNKLLFQSDYINYNWQNDFNNEEIKNVGVEFKLDKWGSISASYNIIDNYTYFDENSTPVQATEKLNYIKVKAHQYFTFRKFTIENTVMYQTVSEGESFFKVPELLTRNTLYYSNHLFKGKPLYMQTGITLKYFTLFNANAYNPLISEFVLQNETEIGNFPILDFFMNVQIQRTRLFLKIENFGASFTGRKYYSAPNYPYRDLTVRFGLVWNFFI
jgi:hypothetical protein